MPTFLLAIIAACLLFGGAAVLGFLEAVFWIVVVVVVLAIVIRAVLAFVRFIQGQLTLSEKQQTTLPPPLDLRDRVMPKFVDQDDYLDWANRRGRWAEE
jgi:hypothetical protein